jgi:predicted O-methyltransferase YrrM
MDRLRRQLSRNKEVIEDEDPGAGSHLKSKDLQVRQIAATSVSSQEKCEWLFRVMLMLQPKHVLELGTSLGVSSLYMAGALPTSTIYTMEGRSSIIKIAKNNISAASVNNIELIEGNFDDTLSATLDQVNPIDFVILDGNHQYTPTMEYMSMVMTKQPMAILVDDIYWSEEMTRAWHEIKSIKHFNVRIDFYHFGLLLHRPEIKDPIDLSFIDYYKKIWRLGFWR